MNSLRILIIGNFLSDFGRARGVCEELALRLRESGCSVLTTSNRCSRVARLADMLRTVWTRRHEYDVAQVDVYSGLSFLWAEEVCRLLRHMGRPYVLTLHGGSLPRFTQRAERRVLALLNTAAAVTVPSQYLLRGMSEYRHDLRLLPNALQVDSYSPTIRRPVRPRLIWLRAFHRIYNPTMAVRVLAQLKGDFPSIRLSMVGPDKGDSSLQDVIAASKNYGVDSHLEVHGAVPKSQVPQVLSRADIFLNTSSVDNTPVTILEAMASGMCVVSTEADGIPYLLESGREALLVPIDDHAAMAAAIRQVLLNQELAERIQMASLDKVRTFDWGVVLPQWLDLFASIVKNRPARTSVAIPRTAELA